MDQNKYGRAFRYQEKRALLFKKRKVTMVQGTMMDTQEGLTKLVEADADEKLAKAVVELLAGAQGVMPEFG